MNKKRMQIGAVAAGIAAASIIIWISFGRSAHPQAPLPSGAQSRGSNTPAGAAAHPSSAADGSGNYDFSEAPDHIGEKATVTGTVVRVFTSKNGATFLDYCPGSGDCPFSAVIFASDAAAFGDLTKYQGAISVTGVIKSYQGRAEMVLDDPSQISGAD